MARGRKKRNTIIRNRPSRLTAEEIEGLLAKLPGFGESTIEALKANAPYSRLSELAALAKETSTGPRRVGCSRRSSCF